MGENSTDDTLGKMGGFWEDFCGIEVLAVGF